jgi:hypothetical protein
LAAPTFWAAACFFCRAGEPISVDQLSGCWEKVYQGEIDASVKGHKSEAQLCFDKNGTGSFVWTARMQDGFGEAWGGYTQYTVTEGRVKVSLNADASRPEPSASSATFLFSCRAEVSSEKDLIFTDCEPGPVESKWRAVATGAAKH